MDVYDVLLLSQNTPVCMYGCVERGEGPGRCVAGFIWRGTWVEERLGEGWWVLFGP